MRVGILSLIHESNTFAVTPTTIDLFQRDELMIGDEVRRGYEGGHHQISAFLEGLPAAGIEGVPIFHASTPPASSMASWSPRTARMREKATTTGIWTASGSTSYANALVRIVRLSVSSIPTPIFPLVWSPAAMPL